MDDYEPLSILGAGWRLKEMADREIKFRTKIVNVKYKPHLKCQFVTDNVTVTLSNKEARDLANFITKSLSNPASVLKFDISQTKNEIGTTTKIECIRNGLTPVHYINSRNVTDYSTW